MNKMLAAISALAVGGGLSICEVCGTTDSAGAAKSAPQVASVPHAAEIRIVTFKVEGMRDGPADGHGHQDARLHCDRRRPDSDVGRH